MGDKSVDRIDGRNSTRARLLQHASRALAVAAVVATATFASGISASQAAPGDRSSASGSFLSGSLLQRLPAGNLAQLGLSSASNDGTSSTIVDRDSVSAGLLNNLLVDIGGGLTVPIRVANVGVLGSYAQATPTASSTGASGVVGNTGAIGVGSVPPGSAPGPMTIDLSQIIGTDLTTEIANLRLELGALSASASSTPPGAPTGTYEIVGGKLLITSPTVAALSSRISTIVSSLQATVNGRLGVVETNLVTSLISSLQGLSVLGLASFPASANNADISVNLSTAGVLPTTLNGGGVSIDLTSGVISVDLDQVAGGLNGRAPNTSLLSASVLTGVGAEVDSLVTGMVTSLTTRLNTALNNASVSINLQANLLGAPALKVGIAGTLAQLTSATPNTSLVTLEALGISVPGTLATTLLGVVRPILAPLLTTLLGDVSALVSTTGGLTTQVLAPVRTLVRPAILAVRGIIDLTVNNQTPTPPVANQAFSVSALRLSLLQRGPLATPLSLEMARGEVGANAFGVVPRIDGLTPTSGPEAGNQLVTITGANFSDAQQVTFDGVPGTQLVAASDTQLTVRTPFHLAGPVDVIVRNVTGNSLPASYTYVAGLALTAAVPNTGPLAGGTTVHLTGSCLDTVTGVTFGGVAGTGIQHLGPNELTVIAPAHAAGAVDVTVTGPAACGTSATLTNGFLYANPAPAVPAIGAVSPNAGPETGSQTVTLTGTNFTGATGVTFDGLPGTGFAVNSATSITVTTPPHTAATVPVVVQHPNGASGSAVYTYQPVIAVTGIAPASGPTAGGQSVTISGRCFTGATGVAIGGQPAAGVTVVSDTSITATTPAGTAGPADVTVTGTSACYGTATLVGGYSFVAPAPPTLTGITPDAGPSTGGTVVQLTGTGFTGATRVLFGGVPATGLTVISPTTIQVTTAARTPGVVDVTVEHPNGAATLPGAYTYQPPPAPTLGALVPNTGPTAGGTPVRLTGTGFAGATGVTFDGLAVTGFTIVNSTTIDVVTPAHTAGPVDVVVAHPSGDATATAGFTYVAPPVPTVSGLDPASGPVGGGTSVTLTGSALSGTTAVEFDGLLGTITSVTDTSVTVTTPPHAAATVDVVLRNPGGDVTRAAAFTYIPLGAPTVTDLSPSAGPIVGGQTVTITGTDLEGVTGVDFGGTAATDVVATPTSITVTTPAHLPGTVSVVLRDPAGDVTLDGAYQYLAVVPTAPTALSFSPTTGPTTGGTLVTITGTGFANSSGVTFGGAPSSSFTVVSATQITAIAPAHAAGPVAVVVEHPLGDATAPGAFTYAAPVPTLSGLNPVSGPTTGGTLVTLSGSGFTPTSTVAIDGVVVTPTFVDATTLTVSTPPHAAATVPVSVTTEGGTATLAGAFTYLTPPPAPTVTAVAPTSGPIGGGTPVTITGTGFTGPASVTFGGTPATGVTVVDANTITAVTPAGAVGTVSVLVTTPNGTSPAAAGASYSYTAAPTITSVAPIAGTTAGGTSVVITGTNLTGTTAVAFGGTAATGFTVDSATQITATTPAHAAGSADVAVATPGGPATLVGGYTFVAPPAIGSITPNSGPVAGGTAVTISGSNLTGTTGVTVGGVAATGVTVVSATTITATVPAGSPGPADVVLQHPAGTATLAGGFTYTTTAPPTVTAVSPASGPIGGGDLVTLTGTNLTGTTGVDFGGAAGSDVTVVNATTVTVRTPAHPAGVVAVVLHHPNGDVTRAAGYEYLAVAPGITSVAPATGPQLGGTVVTISGTALGSATGVTFGGTAATGLTVVDANTIRVTAPAHAPGVVDVAVTLPATTVAATGAFTYTAVPAPTVSGVSPATGAEAGGETVTITGTGFLGTTGVTFGGVPAASYSVTDATTITAITPPGAGLVDVVVQHPIAPATLADAYTYLSTDPPVVTTIAPSSGSTLGGQTVVITGSGFTGTTGVDFGTDAGGAPATDVVVVDDGTITLRTPTHVAGPVDVVLRHPNGDTTVVAGYTFVAGAPAIVDVSPANGSEDGGTTVTLSGTGLGDATAVTFGGTPGTGLTRVDDDTITVVTPLHAPGAVDIVVTLPSGPLTDTAGFTYDAEPSPIVTGMTPTAGPDEGGTVITITGTGFTDATGVIFDGIPGEDFTVVDDTTIIVTTPDGDPGAATVSVLHPRRAFVWPAGFRYVGDADPVISAMSPASGPTSGGTVITITGSGFLAATGVTFGGVAGTGFTVIDDETIQVTTPPGVGGAVEAIVLTASGGSLPFSFLYLDGTGSGGPGDGSGPSSGTAGSGGLVTTGTEGGTLASGGLALLFAGLALAFRGARRRLLQ